MKFEVAAAAILVMFFGLCIALAVCFDSLIMYATVRRHVVSEIIARFGLSVWEMEIFPDRLLGLYGAMDTLDIAFFSIMVRMGGEMRSIFLGERMKRFVRNLHFEYETARRFCIFIDSYIGERHGKAEYMEEMLDMLEDFKWKGKY